MVSDDSKQPQTIHTFDLIQSYYCTDLSSPILCSCLTQIRKRMYNERYNSDAGHPILLFSLDEPQNKYLSAAGNLTQSERLMSRTTDAAEHCLETRGKNTCHQKFDNMPVESSLLLKQMDSREISIENATEGICCWILDIGGYKSWKGRDDTCDAPYPFWIKGKAGTGKSTAMKLLAYDKKQNSGSDTVLSFFFHGRGSQDEKSTMGLDHAFLYRLFKSEPDLCSSLDKLSEVYSRSVAKSGWKEILALKKILRCVLVGRQSWSRLYYFIDALNECRENQVWDTLDLFQSCSATRKLGNTRSSFASRPYPEMGVENCCRFFLDQEPGRCDKIRGYINSRLRDSNIEPSYLDALTGEILLKFSGVFKEVGLAIHILEEATDAARGHSLTLVKQNLAAIPPDLHAVFQVIITKDGNISGRLYLTLRWGLYARRSLTPLQACAAFSVSEDKIGEVDEMPQDSEDLRKVILSALRGWIEITRARNRTLQVIHQSVREVLLTNTTSIELKLSDDFEGQSHHTLAKACSSRIGSVSGLIVESRGVPLFGYARESGFYHADNAQRCGIVQKAFASGFPLRSFRLCRKDRTTLLYLFAERGSEQLIPLCPGGKYQGKPAPHTALDRFSKISEDNCQVIKEHLGAGANAKSVYDNCTTTLLYDATTELRTADLNFISLVLERMPAIQINVIDSSEHTAMFLVVWER